MKFDGLTHTSQSLNKIRPWARFELRLACILLAVVATAMPHTAAAAACCISATSFGVGRLLMWEDTASLSWRVNPHFTLVSSISNSVWPNGFGANLDARVGATVGVRYGYF